MSIHKKFDTLDPDINLNTINKIIVNDVQFVPVNKSDILKGYINNKLLQEVHSDWEDTSIMRVMRLRSH